MKHNHAVSGLSKKQKCYLKAWSPDPGAMAFTVLIEGLMDIIKCIQFISSAEEEEKDIF